MVSTDGSVDDVLPQRAADFAAGRIARVEDAANAVRGLEAERARPSASRSNRAPHSINSRT